VKKNEKLYTVTKTIRFCYGHRLLNYPGKCKNLHGHNGRVEIRLQSATLDGRGMVCDFGDVKKIVGRFIETKLDHTTLLSIQDPLIEAFKKMGQPFYVMKENPTAENIAKLIYHFARRRKLPVVSVRLWETDSSVAVYGEERI
jgi:6-pyruvoyltetrahydropterin/6-carboxytetrahydropterin synthase